MKGRELRGGGEADGGAGANWTLGKAEADEAGRILMFPAWATGNSGEGAQGLGTIHEFICDMWQLR